MNPFVVLGVNFDCTDEEVRAAYHRLLRKYPPETHAEEFQRIQEAYNALKTRRERAWQREICLRKSSESPLGALREYVNWPEHRRVPGAAATHEFLRSAFAAYRRSQQK